MSTPPDTVEIIGKTDDQSTPIGPMGSNKNTSTVGQVNPNTPQLYKTSNDYGNNSSVGTPTTSTVDKTTNAVDKAKDVKDKNNSDPNKPNNPTIASQSKDKDVHSTIKASDPQLVGQVLKKALDAMIMLKMMDKLTSPAGIHSMTSGGIGGALGALAGKVGLGAMQGSLNNVMPQLSQSGLLTSSLQTSFHDGMIGMMSGQPVGALHPNVINQSLATATAISYATTAIASGNSGTAVDAVAAFGGPAFGLTPGSLASKIALLGPGGVLQTSAVINGVKVNTTIVTSQNPMTTSNIPTLNGMEHVSIAGTSAGVMSGDFSTALKVSNPINPAIYTSSAAMINPQTMVIGAAAMVKIVSGIMSGGPNTISTAINAPAGLLTSSGVGGILNNGVGGIISAGLTNILGVGTSGLLGSVTKLLPGIGGNISGTISSHLPKTSLNSGSINSLMTQATKALSLSRAAFNVAKNIFGQARSEQIASAVEKTQQNAATAGGSYSYITPMGDSVTSSIAGVPTLAPAGSAIGSIVRGAGTILGK